MIYVALRNISHEGKTFSPGDCLEDLTAEQARILIDCGALSVSQEPVAPPETTDRIESLHDFNAQDAIKIVESCIDREQLLLWLEGEGRKTVRKALADRIAFLENED